MEHQYKFISPILSLTDRITDGTSICSQVIVQLYRKVLVHKHSEAKISVSYPELCQMHELGWMEMESLPCCEKELIIQWLIEYAQLNKYKAH
jgi:hypothetical protein